MVYSAGNKLFPVFLVVKQKTVPLSEGLLLFRSSGLSGSTDRAGFSAGAAFNAGFRIDFVLSVTFADRGNGTFSSTGATADAFFGNFVSHWINLLIIIT